MTAVLPPPSWALVDSKGKITPPWYRYFHASAENRRAVFTEDTSFYVATTGSDVTGNGSVGNPWATIQKAVDYVKEHVDAAGYICTISVADGTYTAGADIFGQFVGLTWDDSEFASLRIVGDTATPSNVVIDMTTGNPFHIVNSFVAIRGFKLVADAGVGILAAANSFVTVGEMDFGACSDAHVTVVGNATCDFFKNYTISGGSAAHFAALSGGKIINSEATFTVTLTGTPAFSGAFAFASDLGLISQDSGNVTYSGGATGTRYFANYNAGIATGGGGANYFPGNAAGSVANGGYYS